MRHEGSTHGPDAMTTQPAEFSIQKVFPISAHPVPVLPARDALGYAIDRSFRTKDEKATRFLRGPALKALPGVGPASFNVI